MTYIKGLNNWRKCARKELEAKRNGLVATWPRELDSMPLSMALSLDPRLVVIGASPGNSPMKLGTPIPGAVSTWDTLVTRDAGHLMTVSESTWFFYPDGKHYTDKIRCLARGFFSS